MVDHASRLFSFYKFKGTMSEWSLMYLCVCVFFLCLFIFQDIDWVQTEKHVFEQASNHPFLVGLHSCFQTESRWEHLCCMSHVVSSRIGKCGKILEEGEKKIWFWCQNYLKMLFKGCYVGWLLIERHPAITSHTQMTKKVVCQQTITKGCFLTYYEKIPINSIS